MNNRSRILIAVTVLALLFAVCSCSGAKKHPVSDVTAAVDTERSYFSSFEVKGDTVSMECVLTVKNKSDDEIGFYIRGYSGDDAGKLLKDGNLYVRDKDGEERIFSLGPGSSFEDMKVTFTGIYGNANTKADRSLPQIIIVPAK